MYAIIETGSKQYRVEEGDIIDIELISDKKKTTFDRILCINDGKTIELGTPYITNYTVKAEILDTIRAPKVMAFRFKRTRNQRRRKGHRQNYSRVKITAISEKKAKKATIDKETE